MESSSISVAVRVRPFSEKEQLQLSTTANSGPTLFGSSSNTNGHAGDSSFTTPQPPRLGSGPTSLRKVLKVLDDRILVFDPPETNPVHSFSANSAAGVAANMGKKVKDIRFCFDKVFDEECGQEEVYDGSAKELVGHVMNGFHSTVFAYGATGCGKTHTISGSNSQPGIIFLLMKDLFTRISAKAHDTDFSLSISYLEIYNETIRDLLAPDSGQLQLRESNGNAAAAGLSTKEPTCASDVVEWITYGNQNRTVNATEANATSSRSHAVLSVTVTQKPRAGGLTDTTQVAKLSVIDLAGSERASVTKNKGDRLIEGANINRSLLALGNCINALCDPRRRGHVPYRDSKLTRLLKQSLGGNCKTVMIVCVSPSSAHYDETHNTLQYANRAKEIKTKAIRNVLTTDRHVGEYCRQILELTAQLKTCKAELENKTAVVDTEQKERDAKALALAKGKVEMAWTQGRDHVTAGERASSERSGILRIVSMLEAWRATAFASFDGASLSTMPPAASVVHMACTNLIDSLTQKSIQLSMDASHASSALDSYHSLVNSLTTSLKANNPNSLSAFQLEVDVLEARLEASKSEARLIGLQETMKVQAKAMMKMCEARAQVGAVVEGVEEDSLVVLRAFKDAIDSANRAAFQSMAAVDSVGSAGDGGLRAGTKRDAGARSPLEASSPWGHKAMRADSVASPRAAITFFRQSPKKGVSMPKARRDGGGGKAGSSASPAKRKEVQWRDEVSGSGELEDVKWQEQITPESSFQDSPASMPPTPLFTVTSPPPPVSTWAPSSLSSTSSSSSSASSTSILASAAEKMAQSAKLRAATAPLRSRASSARMAPPLPPLAENKPFSFLRHDPHPSSNRSPLSDANRSLDSALGSSSMAGPSGLYAPLVPSDAKPSSSVPDTPRRAAARARRLSQIGPQRSIKTNRRTSYIAPPTPQIPGSVRKASRAGGTLLFAPPKLSSPRKVTSAANRRASMAIGGGGPPPSFPGSKVAARLQQRRESSLNGHAGTVTGSGGSRGSMGAAATSGLSAPLPPLSSKPAWR